MDKRFTQYMLTLQFFRSIFHLYIIDTINFRNMQDKNEEIQYIFLKKTQKWRTWIN